MAAPDSDSIARKIADEAAARYNDNRSRMESVRNKIDHNRKGQLSLSEITNDEVRKQNRVTREESLATEMSPLERINGVANFQDINIIRKIMAMSNAVGRIMINKGYGSSGYGTGFLVHRNLLLTNNHVLPDIQTAGQSTVQFNYEMHPDGTKSTPVTFRLRPDVFFMTSHFKKSAADPSSGLDFTLVGVEDVSEGGRPIEQIKSARLDGGTGKILEGESCVIIQHPKGDYKKIVLKDIRMINLVDDFIVYESDTLPGSSGSMVLGLGTGEVVALHHSAIPRKDENGNWLKKDGSIASPYDSDEEIDWIGNEGIRISRIVSHIRGAALDSGMASLRDTFISGIKGLENFLQSAKTTTATSLASSTSTTATPMENKPTTPTPSANACFFEVQLVNNDSLQEDWEKNAPRFVPGFVRMEHLFENISNPADPKIYFVEARCTNNPWISAELIEKLPHVAFCAPDEPIPTDAMLDQGGQQEMRSPFESGGMYNPGHAQRNEEEFIRKWSQAKHIRKLTEGIAAKTNGKKGKDSRSNEEIMRLAMRAWNFSAVNFPGGLQELKDRNKVTERLKHLRIVQLDTGHSNLTKIRGGIDYKLQYDFVDEDARAIDELKKVGLKHPYHGTRTASIVIGGNMQTDLEKLDGNFGLLTVLRDNDREAVAKVIPYRVANSVVLINRGRNVLSAIEHAISLNADVMFMCMGSLPAPSLDLAARKAYERGIIWVCAAGNHVECIVAPASYPGTIAVAATNPDDRPWKGSSYGKMIDIAAPGEDVYVPFIDRNKDEIMVYGDGTSYATPHVASAAMLWKARYYEEIRKRYKKPWMIVEAFRWCVSKTAQANFDEEGRKWNSEHYGAGILDITALLAMKPGDLPDPQILKNAYEEIKEWPALTSSSAVQAFRTLWQAVTRKINPWEPSGYESGNALTESGQLALEALKRASVSSRHGVSEFESADIYSEHMAFEILRDFTEPYPRNTPQLNSKEVKK